MRNPLRFFAHLRNLALLTCCIALMASSAVFAQTAASSSSELETEHVFVTPSDRGPTDSKDHVFVGPVDRVDDTIPTPTWKAPDRVEDIRKDLPKAKRTWRRVRNDPGLRREAAAVRLYERGELNNDPHFMGRNAIPLEDMEQVILDIPDSVNRKERPMLDMVSTTFGRGVMNVCFGWVEIPRHITKQVREIDPLSGIAVGAIQGATWTIARTAVGVGEIGTGMLDLLRFRTKRPEKLDHRPIIEPEWIIQSVWQEPVPGNNDAFANHDLDTRRDWRK